MPQYACCIVRNRISSDRTRSVCTGFFHAEYISVTITVAILSALCAERGYSLYMCTMAQLSSYSRCTTKLSGECPPLYRFCRSALRVRRSVGSEGKEECRFSERLLSGVVCDRIAATRLSNAKSSRQTNVRIKYTSRTITSETWRSSPSYRVILVFILVFILLMFVAYVMQLFILYFTSDCGTVCKYTKR